MKTIEVVAGVIKHNKSVLCLQKNENKYDYISYKFEFPGGKVEPNEDFKKALMRELHEEMDVQLEEEQLSYLMTVQHQYPDFHIIMHTYVCETGDIEFRLHEHIDAKWSTVETIDALDWAAADLPIVEKLKAEKII